MQTQYNRCLYTLNHVKQLSLIMKNIIHCLYFIDLKVFDVFKVFGIWIMFMVWSMTYSLCFAIVNPFITWEPEYIFRLTFKVESTKCCFKNHGRSTANVYKWFQRENVAPIELIKMQTEFKFSLNTTKFTLATPEKF